MPRRVASTVLRRGAPENGAPYPTCTTTDVLQAKAAIRNTVIGILHLHQVPSIAAQLRSCHRDPYRLPLQLLGLTRPLMPTGNPAVT